MNCHSVALVDDHRLLTESLAALINTLPEYKVSFIAENGIQLQHALTENGDIPDIVLLDVSMPGMDGFQTAAWLRTAYPTIRVLALSTHHNETVILRMLRLGCKGYLLKDIRPNELLRAFNALMNQGFYTSEYVTGRLLHGLQNEPKSETLSSRELEFLRLCTTEMTYKEIADVMKVSPKTVEGYRETLFEKLEVKSRIGLAMYAIKHHIVEMPDTI